jgi:tRNA-Thr(GGU) m(6)t(6)A37 methyltransferase TsaA
VTKGTGDEPELTLRPIGYVRAASGLKFNTPRQPDPKSSEVSLVELLPGRQFELALQDLEGFDKIWLVSWLDQNRTWRPRVLPPRGPAKRRGVFATRSPHRPNPIGLSCVTLIDVSSRILKVGALDLTDGTPILDIKPYLRTIDCFPESRLGWIEEIEEEEAKSCRFQITLEPLAEEKLNWLKEELKVDFTARAFDILRRDPTRNRTRRILQLAENRYRIACGPWRMFYRLEDEKVIVTQIASGLSEETLNSPGNQVIADRDTHIAFQARFQV